MFSKITSCLFALSLALSLTTNAHPQFHDSTLVTGFSKGFAITAEELGLESASKNPATLTSVQKNSFSSTYSSYYNHILQSYNLSWAIPLFKRYIIGLQFPNQVVQNIPHTQAGPENEAIQIGQFQDKKTGTALSVAFKGSQSLSLGATLSGTHQKIFNQTQSSFGLDLGLLRKQNWGNIGISIQNMGSKRLINNAGFTLLTPPYGHISIDASQQKKEHLVNIGYTLPILSNFIVSAGIKDITHSKQLRLGLELRLANVAILIAQGHHDVLGPINKVGITFQPDSL